MKPRTALVVLGVATILAVTGCAQKKIFTKPGLTQAQWDRDYAQCEYEATSSTQNVDYSYQSVVGQALDQALRRRNLMELCLKAKGYVEQKQ